LEECEKAANKIPEFKKACDKNGVPAGMALAGICGFAALLLLWFQGLAIVSTLVTCVYPMI